MILDIGRTLERLETLSVPVLGYGCDQFPAFYRRDSGHRVSARVNGPEDAARLVRAAWGTGANGIVVAVPPPAELDGAEEITRQAVAELQDLHGADATPRLLARVAELSSGQSVQLNVELVINNARIAARVARAYSG
jgi:pseudouridine-5'-phosphate glycosidase